MDVAISIEWNDQEQVFLVCSFKMKTSIEDLPVEIWMFIFAYFEAHELLHAFTNLNHYFDQLIASDYLLFPVRLGKNARNPLDYSVTPYWSHSILNRILSLRPCIQHQTSHIPEFLRWHCYQLVQLKSLKVKLRGREISALCTALPQLTALDSLSIECVPNQMLLEAILSAPVLRICQLNFLRPVTPIKYYSTNNLSSLEILQIKLQDDSNSSIMNFLLNHMPRLKRLEMNNYDIYVKNREWIFFQSLFVLPQLRTMKATWSANYSTPPVFQNLHQNLPALQHLHVQIAFDFISEDLLNHITDHWWPIFQTIEQITILIRCKHLSLIIDQQLQTHLDAFQSTLFAINVQFNGSVKADYVEKFSMGHRISDISICKFY